MLIGKKTIMTIKKTSLYIKKAINELCAYEVPDQLIALLILGEDRRFLSHNGIDFLSIIRAIYLFISARKIQGASTIEQQLVRTITNQREISVHRKLREMFFAVYISRIYTKKQIATAYLRCAYFGWRMNGLKEVLARMNIDINNGSIHKFANIIARIKYPEPRILSLEKRSKIEKRVDFLMGLYNLKAKSIMIKLVHNIASPT